MLFFSRKCILLDPIEKEERVAEGKLVVGLNQHREICMLQISGHMMIQQDVVRPYSGFSLLPIYKCHCLFYDL